MLHLFNFSLQVLYFLILHKRQKVLNVRTNRIFLVSINCATTSLKTGDRQCSQKHGKLLYLNFHVLDRIQERSCSFEAPINLYQSLQLAGGDIAYELEILSTAENRNQTFACLYARFSALWGSQVLRNVDSQRANSFYLIQSNSNHLSRTLLLARRSQLRTPGFA